MTRHEQMDGKSKTATTTLSRQERQCRHDEQSYIKANRPIEAMGSDQRLAAQYYKGVKEACERRSFTLLKRRRCCQGTTHSTSIVAVWRSDSGGLTG
jgi:hypothetical protein